MRRVLGIETSGVACRIALLEADGRPASVFAALETARVREREYSGDAARHSEAVFRLLDAVLGGRSGLARVDGIAVSAGPGSFTGLRVGMAVAKVLARFGRLPLASVGTLEAMAIEAVAGTGAPLAAAALDAKRGEVYAAAFRRTRSGVKRVRGPAVVVPGRAAAGLPAGTPIAVSQPRAATVAAVGLMRLLAGRRDDPVTLVPVYVRRPEAVEKRLRARRGK